ncbi:MAG: permease [Clostridiales bacterium]|nr:permease [Roseburia sp.]MDD7637628.1 permease [Clostridiales bacterium]MDY4113620.1 permease [Roseburia sp.]
MLLIQMVMLLTGGLMIAIPGACTRKEARGNAEAEKRTRTMGIWLLMAALIWVVTAKIF